MMKLDLIRRTDPNSVQLVEPNGDNNNSMLLLILSLQCLFSNLGEMFASKMSRIHSLSILLDPLMRDASLGPRNTYTTK